MDKSIIIEKLENLKRFDFLYGISPYNTHLKEIIGVVENIEGEYIKWKEVKNLINFILDY